MAFLQPVLLLIVPSRTGRIEVSTQARKILVESGQTVTLARDQTLVRCRTKSGSNIFERSMAGRMTFFWSWAPSHAGGARRDLKGTARLPDNGRRVPDIAPESRPATDDHFPCKTSGPVSGQPQLWYAARRKT